MTYVYKIQKDGEWVDMNTLPKEQVKEIKRKLTERLAEAIAEREARKAVS